MLADEGEPCVEARGVKVRGDSIPALSLQVVDVELSFERKLTAKRLACIYNAASFSSRTKLIPGIGL